MSDNCRNRKTLIHKLYNTYGFADFLVDKFATGSLYDLSAIAGRVVGESTTICKSLNHFCKKYEINIRTIM